MGDFLFIAVLERDKVSGTYTICGDFDKIYRAVKQII